jgi:hypothetical protein
MCLQEAHKAQAANRASALRRRFQSTLWQMFRLLRLSIAYHHSCSRLQEVRKAQAANRARLDEEYRRLVGNLVEAQQLQGGEEWLANPALPEDIVRESMPGMCFVRAPRGGGTFTAGEHHHTFGPDTFRGCYICS